jgi:putative SOS response-associated peptidase YedK
MCGRFTLTIEPAQLQEAFPWVDVPPGFSPRYNVAPSQAVAVLPNDGSNRLDFFVWGLIPFWAKDPEIGNRLINARSETLLDKPAFRSSFRNKRCLVFADGFYEWRKEPGSSAKTPMYIQLKSGKSFAFAGLWDIWHSPDGSEVRSCTIITTRPNSLMESIHDRMPVILDPAAHGAWLVPGQADPRELGRYLEPFPADAMQAFPVSRAVNSPKNDSPELIIPLAQED